MDQLFKKAAVLTDAHFGRSGGSEVANKDNLDFIDFFIERARSWGAETCLFLGDWHDNRFSIGVHSLHYSLKGLERLSESFKDVYAILGNHDLYFRDNRNVSSVEWTRHLNNIHLISDPLTVGEVTFLPWLMGDEHKKLKNLKSRYVFGHLEVPGFLLNSKIEMQDSPDAIKLDQFVNQEYVFSGHFHMRQTQRVPSKKSDSMMIYMGNIMPFNFTDANDENRGMMMLEWGKEPDFETWKDQPTYLNIKMSELLDNPNVLKPKMTVHASLDVVLTYEETQELKTTLIEGYNLRKLELVGGKKEESSHDYSENVVFKSVDQMVLEGLGAIDSDGLSKDRLMKEYQELMN